MLARLGTSLARNISSYTPMFVFMLLFRECQQLSKLINLHKLHRLLLPLTKLHKHQPKPIQERLLPILHLQDHSQQDLSTLIILLTITRTEHQEVKTDQSNKSLIIDIYIYSYIKRIKK